MKYLRLVMLAFAATALSAAPIRLENDSAVAEISPETGRITAWRLKKGENLLWNNHTGNLSHQSAPGWKNYGGDKVWLVPQKQRYNAFGNDAPDPVIDGQPWQVAEHTPYSVVLKSGRSDALHCMVTRTIVLDRSKPELTVTARAERFAPSPLPVELWTVTQARRPEYGLLGLDSDFYPGDRRWRLMRKSGTPVQVGEFGDLLEVRFGQKGWEKISSWGRLVAAVYPGVIFLQEFDAPPEGCFPERCTAQIFVGEEYLELESHSALCHLKAGEAIESTIRWRLVPRPAERNAAADREAVRREHGGRWVQIAPGGGGRTMYCQPFPGYPDRLLCTGDMGGVFYSADGGRSWRLADSRRMERVPYTGGTPPWEFVPERPGEVWAGSKTRGLLRSRDFGATWEAVPGPWERLTMRDWWHSMGPELIRFTSDGQYALAFWKSFGDNNEKKLFESSDAGEHWREISLPGNFGLMRAICFGAPGEALLLSDSDLYRLRDGRIEQLPAKLPGKVFAGAVSGDGIYAASKLEDGSTRLLRINGTGEVRELDFHAGGGAKVISALGAALTDSRTLYVGTRGTGECPAAIWKSADSGKNWRKTLIRKADDPDINISPDRWTTGRWGWNTAPASISVDRNNSDLVTFTDFTMCGYSRDGGRSWEIVSTGPVRSGLIPGGGMPMLTGWNYYLHGSRHHAATTDFANWRSDDGGRNWSFAPPENTVWHNNIYAYAFDPADPDRMWAAASLKHDLPYWHHLITQGRQPRLWRGGVLSSTDGGKNWTMPDLKRYGLPDLPVTDLLRASDGVLYAAVLGGGIYRSSDGGKSWTAWNDGLPDCPNTLRIVESPDGRFYAVVTAKWDHRNRIVISGGIYRRRPAGGNWEKLPLPADFVFPVSLTFSEDGKTLYSGCFRLWRERRRTGGGAYAEPGLWRFDADGGNARKMLDGLPVYEARPVPGRPAELYCGTVGEGLFRSGDGGASWHSVLECPAGNIHTITFDPSRPTCLFVTTFGQGIWHGQID